MSCGVGRRYGSTLMLLWLWCRLAATSPIRSLAWELPCAMGVPLKRQKIKNKKIFGICRGSPTDILTNTSIIINFLEDTFNNSRRPDLQSVL